MKSLLFEIKLIGVWLLVILLINPLGEFPLNDDWAYSQNVWFLSEEGRLHFSDWPGMTLIAQTLTGALSTSLFGFSFSILRLTTLLFGLSFLLVLYRLLRKLGAEKKIAGFTTLVILFTPFFLSLSFTFMTEIYFLFFFYVSLLFYHRYLQRHEWTCLLLSIFFALAATLTRQTGMIIPVAIGITGLIRSAWKPREILLSLLPMVIVTAGLWGYQYWLEATGNVYGNYARTGDLLGNFNQLHWVPVLGKAGTILMYAGLFLLPLSVRMIPAITFPRFWSGRIILIIVFLGITGCLFLGFKHFPAPNFFYNLGLGPRLVKDAYWGDNISPVISPAAWTFIKVVAVAGVYLLPGLLVSKDYPVADLLRGIRTDARKSLLFTLILMCLGYFAYMILNRFFFDRYTLAPVILLAVILATMIRAPAGVFHNLSTGILLVFMLFSITAVHDFMEWNRARWAALGMLMEEGIGERRIDGGLEFNAWYGAGPYNPAVKGEKSWWFVTEDEYVIASGPIEGFQLYKSLPYSRWLFPGKDSVQILWHEIEGMIPYSSYPVVCNCEILAENPLYLLSLKDSIRFEGGPLRSGEHARSGNYSVKLDKEHPFAFLHRFKDIQAGETFRVRIWRYGERNNILIGAGGSEGCPTVFSNNVIHRDEDGWDLMELVTVIPDSSYCDRLGIYLWNNEGSNVWLDDLEIHRIPPEYSTNNVSTSISPGN